ncbi:MAG: hypothetical protein IT352_16125 [Gemmatimonadales bacterium]|nr:hypothetical protein [Gemmatimonadales bacterium]
MPAGLPVFIGLPVLGAGVYHLRVRGESEPDGSEVEGELEMVIRTPRPWTPGWSGQGIVEVELDPPTPTLEDVWEGHVAIEVRGPAGRPVGCRIKLFERSGDAPIFDRRLPQLQMPVSPAQWQAHFRRHCREAGGAADAENAYDRARLGHIEFIAQEFGSFNVTCERDFTPLRWGVRRRGHGQDVVLLDDSGAIASASCCRFAFESPDLPEAVQPSAPSEPLEVPLAGGMYVARQGSLVAAVIVPPIVRDIAALGCAPTFVDRTRSLANATRLLELIELWSRARLAGNIMSEVRQRAVLRALTHQLFFVIGGEVWERAEGLFAQGPGGVQELKLAVSAKRQEVGLAAALTLECAALALAPIERRVQRLSSLVKSFVPRESSEVKVPSDEEDRHLDRSTDWLSEFALRLASDPGGVRSWAGAAATSGLERLWEKPMLARAARFFVLVVERHLRELAVDAPDLYAGWGWR